MTQASIKFNLISEQLIKTKINSKTNYITFLCTVFINFFEYLAFSFFKISNLNSKSRAICNFKRIRLFSYV